MPVANEEPKKENKFLYKKCGKNPDKKWYQF